MPYRSPRPCPRNGCTERTSGGPCPKHRADRNRILDAAKDPAVIRLYRSARWQLLRQAVLAETPLCPRCREDGQVERATTVDHVLPHRGDMGLFFDRGNLQALCKRHHDSKTAREVWHGGRPSPAPPVPPPA